MKKLFDIGTYMNYYRDNGAMLPKFVFVIVFDVRLFIEIRCPLYYLTRKIRNINCPGVKYQPLLSNLRRIVNNYTQKKIWWE